MASDYYPETMGNTFIINAPLIFSGVWAVIKGFLDEKSRTKIKILGTSYQEELLQLCDKEALPTYLGGTCECPEGCLTRQPGPWDRYERTAKGIRLKADKPEEKVEEVKEGEEEVK